MPRLSLAVLVAGLALVDRAPAQTPDLLALGSASGAPGSTATVSVSLSSSAEAEGFSFGVAHDGTRLTATSVVPGAALDPTVVGGIAPAFFQESISPAGGAGITLGVVIDFSPPFVGLPTGATHAVADITYDISPTALPGSSPLVFTALLGAPPVEILISVGGLEVLPALSNGSVVASAVPFVRGDLNGDGALNLVDAVVFLRRQFAIDPPSTCEDSDDIDDSGALDITDPVFLLNHLFGGGPPLPGPLICGVDATLDGIGCSTYGGCP